ncbi:MAG: hypothetical protein WEA81_02475, partial [Dehalococcoidia bacterium]
MRERVPRLALLGAHALGHVLEHLVDEHAVHVGEPPLPASHALLVVAPSAHRPGSLTRLSIVGAGSLDLMGQALEVHGRESRGAKPPHPD